MSDGQEIPLQISENNVSLFGILRKNNQSRKLVVFLPSPTGSRIGPQRIFVELARKIQTLGFSSFCFDLPTFADSYDLNHRLFTGSLQKQYTEQYSIYLDLIKSYFDEHFPMEEYILASISVGCIPVLNYSKQHGFKRTILFSPNHLAQNIQLVNKKNLKTYFYKILTIKTWKKLWSGRLHFRRILNNVFTIRNLSRARMRYQTTFDDTMVEKNDRISILCIFGENDDTLPGCRAYWEAYQRASKMTTIRFCIIPGSDHSFFGWKFKQAVGEETMKWLKGTDSVDLNKKF